MTDGNGLMAMNMAVGCRKVASGVVLPDDTQDKHGATLNVFQVRKGWREILLSLYSTRKMKARWFLRIFTHVLTTGQRASDGDFVQSFLSQCLRLRICLAWTPNRLATLATLTCACRSVSWMVACSPLA